MKKLVQVLILLSMAIGVKAQYLRKKVDQSVDLAFVVGSDEAAASASYDYNWLVGKRQKIEIGLGLRYTGYFGTKRDFITAPAKLARTFTTPFLIFFAGQREENFDTLTVQRPFTNSVNLAFNIGYNFSKKWGVGFNIDLIGFTFGKETSAVFTGNGQTQFVEAKPAGFNVLLTGDHDRGMLNSEFFLRYKISDRWGIRANYSYIFVEYQTPTAIQTAPDGTMNNRFRNKADAVGLAVSYHF